jgi:hypothetical protein
MIPFQPLLYKLEIFHNKKKPGREAEREGGREGRDRAIAVF